MTNGEMQEYQSGINVASTNIEKWIYTWGLNKTRDLIRREMSKHQTQCSYNEGILAYYNDYLVR